MYRFKLRGCLSWGLLLLILSIATSLVNGQNLSNLRLKKVALQPAGQLIDSLTVVPNSLEVFAALPKQSVLLAEPINRNFYQLNGRYLQWIALPKVDSIWLHYRVLPFDLTATRRLVDTTQFRRDQAGQIIGTYNPYTRGDIFESNGGVNYNGAFTRGISFGNRQDLVLNSAFNLQMEGALGNGIIVRAAITDESLPIQPEGNTQQLREFDQVFIQLQKKNSILTAGDYELRNPEGYFMRYFKKLEGATFKTSHGATADEKGEHWEHSASIAIARGQFVRQPIQPSEGNQGPYKLTGSGNQRFLIILSGTERIYLDGKLMKRGQDADYIIDYNLAELTFTQKRLITRDSRIVAEYEYADQRYVRSLYAANSRFESGPWTAYINLFNQQDSKTATGDLDLSLAQRQALAEAGDSEAGIFVSGIDSLGNRVNQRATYHKIDTLVFCGADVVETFVLRFTTALEGPLFTAAFTDFGPNGGPYELAPLNTANERTYEYVGYDENCLPLGRYAPVVELGAPEKQQLITFGGSYINKGSKLAIEAGRSLLDRNRFSGLDSEDDQGYALRFDGEQLIPLGKRDSSWQVVLNGSLERRQANFRPPNPYRSTDFFRNWNLSNRLGTETPESADEELIEASLLLQSRGWGGINYSFGRFSRGKDYLGNRQSIGLNLNRSGWQLTGEASYLDNQKTDSRGTFWKPQLRLSKQFAALNNWQLSAEYTAEQSLQKPIQSDTLLPISFGFERIAFGLGSNPEADYQLNLQARRRTDVLPNGSKALVEATIADELAIEGAFNPNRTLQIGGNFTYRKLDVKNSNVVNQTPGQTFLGRLDISFRTLNNSLRSQTAYTLGSGQEARVEFQYLFVGAGLGQYIWQDSLFNNDGRIQPNEMAISPFQDIADYVRVSVFTNDFIRTDNAGINQSLNWDLSRLWEKPNKLQAFAKKFNLQSSLTINRKTRETTEIQLWNPFQLAVSDSALVALSAGTRHNLFFNRRNPKFDIQLTNRDLRRRQVLTTGYEASRQREWIGRFSFRPHSSLNLILGGSIGNRAADSEFFDNKDFDIRFRRFEPEADWQPGKDFRLNGKLIVSREVNELLSGNGENSQRLEINLSGNYRRWLDISLRSVTIELDGEARSPVGFALLNGLQPGNNWLWNLTMTRQLGQYLQLNLGYEGRQTGKAATVHLGRAQVTALF